MITFLNTSRPDIYKLNFIISVRNYINTVMCKNNKSLTKLNRFAYLRLLQQEKSWLPSPRVVDELSFTEQQHHSVWLCPSNLPV